MDLEYRKLYWMIKKEWLSLKRHPSRLVAIIIFPIIMILLFGYGMGGDLTNLPVVVVSQSDGHLTDQTLTDIKANDAFSVVDIIDNVDDGKAMVDSGKVKAAIILPSNYDDNDTTQKTATLYLDSSDQMASQVLIPSSQQIFNQISINELQSSNSNLEVQNSTNTNPVSSQINSAKSSISIQINKIYGDIKYIDFLVPAVLAMTVMMSCMMGMGAAIAGERETGELARLFMTPTSVATVIGGKILAKLSVEMMRAIVLLVAAIILFSITIKGGILQTLLLLFIGALCFVGFGVALSARAQTQEDYSQMVMPFSMPMMFVSGVFYPIETMPWIFQKIAYIFPLTYLNDAMRAVMIQGRPLSSVWLDILILLGFTLLFFLIGVKRFNRDV
ncbi:MULTISPECIES: ABC transporter permease [Methanobrevibacter]|uniref:ABC transporter permease n=1 Tax=Methanobrevibacter TaxID=2172 RepID=UPI00033484EF|nr:MULTISPECIES: ABC transporter permease [Methanobrevibacter]AGN15951.1 ABC transporter permease protein [Methanobrevibacter sp. AbM4]